MATSASAPPPSAGPRRGNPWLSFMPTFLFVAAAAAAWWAARPGSAGVVMLKLYWRKGNPVPARRRITSVPIDKNKWLAGRGLIAGLLTAAVSIGVGQLVAGITGPDGSPVVAVGSLSIDHAPPAVKDFAITAFGSHDKLVLVSGILVVLAIFAAVIGAVAVRRLSYGMIGLAIFGAVGLLAATTRPDSTATDVLPTLAGTLAGGVALFYLVRAAGTATPSQPPAVAGRPGSGRPGSEIGRA